MKSKFYFIFFILSLISTGYCTDYLLPNSDKQIISKEELQNKSKMFYRYARNEIFARKGYKFKDPDLVLFFTNTSWYYPQESIEMNLSDTEKENINILKSLESDTALEQTSEILFKYDLNQYPLFYIGYELKKIYRKSKWRRGKFVILDKKYYWALKCNSIPPEFLSINSNSEIRLDENGRSLLENQISLDDIDEGCDKNLGIEVRVELVGPSDDDEILYFGFDDNKQFKQLFSIPSGGFKKKKISNTKLLLSTSIRKDLQGTSWFNQDYLFDTISKKIYIVPDLFLYPKFPDRSYKCKTTLSVYYDGRSAAKEEALAKIDTIKPGMQVYFLKFYRVEGKGSAQIKYKLNGAEYNGWLNQKDIGPWNFEGMSAAD